MLSVLQTPLAKHISQPKSAAHASAQPKKFGFILKPRWFYFKTWPKFVAVHLLFQTNHTHQ
jgi:hypothetical protein